MPGYRQSIQRCEACLREVAQQETLPRFGGLQVCPACLDDHQPAVKAWRLKLLNATWERSETELFAKAKVICPTKLEVHANLKPEGLGDRWRRLLYDITDSKTGTPFDKAVWIADSGGALTQRLLSSADVQRGVLAALDVAGEIQIRPTKVVVIKTMRWSSGLRNTGSGAVDRVAVALAICIERWAQRQI